MPVPAKGNAAKPVLEGNIGSLCIAYLWIRSPRIRVTSADIYGRDEARDEAMIHKALARFALRCACLPVAQAAATARE